MTVLSEAIRTMKSETRDIAPWLPDDQALDMASFEKILHTQTLEEVRVRFLQEVLNGGRRSTVAEEEQGGSVELF